MSKQIGDRMKDTISGFQGIATGMTEYLNGCRQFLIKTEKLDKEGKAIEGMWIDEQYLEVTSPAVLPNPFALVAAAREGGADSRSRRK